MKAFPTLLLFLSLLPAQAYAEPPKVCEGKNFGTCFRILLQERCAAYANWNLFSRREFLCEQSVITMVDLFKPFQPKDDPDHVVAFPKQITELIADAKAFAYLQDIPGEIDQAIQAGRLFNLWDFTLARTGKNEDLALQWIAVLFQDNNPDANIVLAESKLTPKENHIWSEAIRALSYDRLTDRSADSDAVFLVVFPEIDATYLSSGMYHFYVSAHLARELQKVRKSVTPAGIDMNGFAPFLLNTMYEMQADQDPGKSPLKDAKPFSAQKKNHSLRDTYAGYLGALYGLGGKDLVAKAEPFDSFSKRYAKDPSGTMRSLYSSFRPKK